MILVLVALIVLLRVFYSLAEVYFERDWPRSTWRGLLVSLGLLLMCGLAFGQTAARVDIPIQTSGPNVPVTGGPLPQALWVANASVIVCAHVTPYSSQTYANCAATPLTTYIDSAESATCPSSAPLVQLPGNTCTASTGTDATIGLWFQGGAFDYYVTSSYGTFGPYTADGSNGSSGGGSTPSHTETALLAVRQGTASMHVWAYGDSTVFGFDSNYASSTDCTTYGWPRLLANDLATYYGLPTLADSFFGAGLNGFSNYGICDPQVTLGTGWAQDYTYVLPGGGTFKATTATSGTLHFTSLGQTDTLKIYYLTGSGFGTINGSIDGGSVTTQSSAGSLGLSSMILTASSGVGTHYADIAAPTGGNIYIWGEEWSNSVTPSVIVDQVGWPGASSVNLSNKSSVPGPGYTLPYQTVGCDLGIFEAGAINDWQAATTIPNFTTNVETTFGAMKAAGCDVALLTPVPSSTSVTAQATQQTYVAAMNAVSAAESNNGQTGPLPVVHVFESIGNYLTGAAWYGAAGLYNGTIHPNNLGYQFIASKIESALFPFPNADEGQNQAPFTGMQTPCYTRNVSASTATTVSDCALLMSGSGITLTLSVVPTDTRYSLVNYGSSAVTL